MWRCALRRRPAVGRDAWTRARVGQLHSSHPCASDLNASPPIPGTWRDRTHPSVAAAAAATVTAGRPPGLQQSASDTEMEKKRPPKKRTHAPHHGTRKGGDDGVKPTSPSPSSTAPPSTLSTSPNRKADAAKRQPDERIADDKHHRSQQSTSHPTEDVSARNPAGVPLPPLPIDVPESAASSAAALDSVSQDATEPSLPPPPFVVATAALPITPPAPAPRPPPDLNALVSFLTGLWSEYCTSASEKVRHPWKTIRDLALELSSVVWNKDEGSYTRTYKQMWLKFADQYGLKVQPVPPYRDCLSFSASTDMSRFEVLNDASFGGSSTCRVDLLEHITHDDATGKEQRRYTIRFCGELANLPALNVAAPRWSEDKATHRQVEPTPQEDQNGARVEPMTMSSKPPPKGKTTTPASPEAFVESPSEPVPLPQAESQPEQAESSRSPVDADPAPAEPTASTASTASNPFLRSTEPSTSVFRRLANSLSSLSPSKRAITERLGMVHGFASFTSPPFAVPDLDCDRYDFISMRVRTDGRPYKFNVRCREHPTRGHGIMYQGRIAEETPRPMHKLEVRFKYLLCMQNGRPRPFDFEIPKHCIQSFGFSVTGPPGPFELELEYIAAEVGTPVFEIKELDMYNQRFAAKQQETAAVSKWPVNGDKKAAILEELERLRAAAAPPAPAGQTQKTTISDVMTRVARIGGEKSSTYLPDYSLPIDAQLAAFRQEEAEVAAAEAAAAQSRTNHSGDGTNTTGSGPPAESANQVGPGTNDESMSSADPRTRIKQG